MKTRSPRLLIWPLLIFTLGLLVACGTAATPTAVPSTPDTTDAMTADSMDQENDAMEEQPEALEEELVSGWYRDREVQYYDFGSNSPLDDARVGTAPIYVFIHGFNADGSPEFVQGQHNVVDVVPGDVGYSDLWRVMLVTVPEGYEPDSITSKVDLDAAGYEVTPTDMLVNCPIVPEGTTLEGGEDLVQGWYQGEEVFYPDFGMNTAAAIPIWVFITGMDEEGNPQFVEGQRNIIDAVPGDPGYSAFWRVNLVTVPEGYEPNNIRSAEGVRESGFDTSLTDMVVNCPVISVSES